jgi:arabinose-5-phosphate isomerase
MGSVMKTETLGMTTNDILQEAHRVMTTEAHAIEQAAVRLGEPFAHAVRLCAEARTILVFGVGKSGIIGQKIAATLTSTGSPAMFVHPVEALHGDIGIAREGDVAVILSKSGTTSELLSLMPSLKARLLPVVGLLGTLGAPLVAMCDVVLDARVDMEGCPLGIAPMSSTTVALALGDALAAVLMRVRGFTAEAFAANHAAGQLGKNLNLAVRDVMHFGTTVPYVPLHASFREALVAMTGKGLGCVCVVESLDSAHRGFMRLVGLITDGDVRRALEMEQHDDLRMIALERVMTRHPLTTSPETLLGTALATMERRERQLSVLPVVDAAGACVGVIRIHDIVRAGL